MGKKKDKARVSGGSDTRKVILDAVLELAASYPWQSVSYGQIAEKARMTIQDVEDCFASKQDMVKAIVSDMDGRVLGSYQVDASSSKRDLLFDVLMERFDAMTEHRAAHLSFLKSYGWTYSSKRRDLNLYFCSLSRYVSVSGIETRGLFGPMNVAAIGLGYFYVLTVWSQDSSSDLTRTMAALDKTLSRLDWLKEYISRPVRAA
ncbi:MAG TPA: TetR/AcrR family transcriptional regulator [Alphaproteobacteria bacterium]|nr:TetR/AcrR family transcriptional regulator [Alphaproteobacteria bacterium]